MEQPKKDLENIKLKLIEHINANYEKDQAKNFIENINSMNDEEFLAFLKEQGLLGGEKNQKSQCIFCSIVFGDIPFTKIGENKKAIAILEVKPVSLGHSLILPKEHITSKEKLSEEVGKLALEIEQNLKATFNPKRVERVSSNIMGHEILNLLPIYDNETIDSKRKILSVEDLQKIKKKLEKKEIEEELLEEAPKESIEKEINEKNTWLPKRLP